MTKRKRGRGEEGIHEKGLEEERRSGRKEDEVVESEKRWTGGRGGGRWERKTWLQGLKITSGDNRTCVTQSHYFEESQLHIGVDVCEILSI